MLRVASVFAVCALIQAAAGAGTVQISGSGTWGSNAPTTVLSAPGETWSFSVDLDVNMPISSFTSLSVSNPSYVLNGTPVVSQSIGSITFFSASADGMFNLNFLNTPSGEPGYLALYGPQVFDAYGNLIPGTYQPAIDVEGSGLTPPEGSGSGTVIISEAVAVPEPPSAIGGGIAMLALAGLGLVRRRSAA